jgi:uncharacterized protein
VPAQGSSAEAGRFTKEGSPRVGVVGRAAASRRRDPGGRREARTRGGPWQSAGVDDGRDLQGFLTPERVRGHFDRAVACWNAGAFFEAHEDWEALWQEAEGAHRTWLQGLIQWAAAFHHVERGTSSGFVKLARSGAQKLAGYAGDTHGLDVAALAAALEPWRAHAERVASGAAMRGPRPELPTIRYRPGVVPRPLPPEPDAPEDDAADDAADGDAS